MGWGGPPQAYTCVTNSIPTKQQQHRNTNTHTGRPTTGIDERESATTGISLSLGGDSTCHQPTATPQTASILLIFIIEEQAITCTGPEELGEEQNEEWERGRRTEGGRRRGRENERM